LGDQSGPTSHLEIAVAPLTLPDIVDACYDLRVTNAPGGLGQTVFERTGICSSTFGDSRGAITYVGTCDAGAGLHTVSLTMTSLTGTTGPAAFVNPCPSGRPCALETPCAENADTPVVFNLTIMRSAQQGFFDVAVNFEDLFCSAKADCVGSDGPLTLLHDPRTPNGPRLPTVVLALACTGGLGAATELHWGEVSLVCGSTTIPLAISGPPGNVYSASTPAPAPLLQLATYRGTESLADAQGVSWGKLYYNVAFALDLANPLSACSLRATASASDGPFTTPFTTPANTAWPLVRVDLPVVSEGQSTYACSRHPLGTAPEDRVWVTYTEASTPVVFDHRAYVVASDVRVDDRPGSGPLTVTPPTVVLGRNGTHTYQATGGLGPYTWSVQSGGGSFAGALFTAPNVAPGNVTVRVTDARGTTATGAVVIVPDVAIDPSATTVAVGNGVTFTASGGQGPYTFDLDGPGTLVGPLYTATAVGTAEVRATDSLGGEATATITINPSLTIAPSSVTVAAGGTQTFSTTGGVGTVTYSVPSGGGLFAGNVYTAPSQPGAAVVRATDSLGNTSEASVTINPGSVWVASTSSALYYSNTGNDWTQATVPDLGGRSIQTVIYGGGKFVALGTSGLVLNSSDGISWTNVTTSLTGNRPYAVALGNAILTGGLSAAATIDGGANWSGNISGGYVAISGGRYFTTFWQGQCPCFGNIYRSSTAVGTLPTPASFSSILSLTTATGPVYGVAVAAGGTTYYYATSQGLYKSASDGTGMTAHYLSGTSLSSIADNGANPNVMVAMANGTTAHTSIDNGATWAAHATGATGGVGGVRWSGQRFIARGTTQLVTSSNGVDWTILGTLPASTNGVTVKE
jgi:hypothetical protein